MPPIPDIRPTSHDTHDPLLIAALAAGDLAVTDRVHATELIETAPIAPPSTTISSRSPASRRPSRSDHDPPARLPAEPRAGRAAAPSGWRRVVGAFGSRGSPSPSPSGSGWRRSGWPDFCSVMSRWDRSVGRAHPRRCTQAPPSPPEGPVSPTSPSRRADSAIARQPPPRRASRAGRLRGFGPYEYPSTAASSVPAALGVPPAPSGSTPRLVVHMAGLPRSPAARRRRRRARPRRTAMFSPRRNRRATAGRAGPPDIDLRGRGSDRARLLVLRRVARGVTTA